MVFKSIDESIDGVLSKVENAISTVGALISGASNESTFTFDEKFIATLNKDKQALELYIKALRDEKSEVEAVASSFKEATASAKVYAETHREIKIEEFEKQQRAAQVATAAQNHTLTNSKVIIDEYNAILTDSAHEQEDNYRALSKTKLSQTEYLDAVKKSNPPLAKYLSKLRTADGTTKGYVGSLILAKTATAALTTVKVPVVADVATTSLSDLSDALQKLKSNYDIVATAEKEMLEGGLTPSTIKALADEEAKAAI